MATATPHLPRRAAPAEESQPSALARVGNSFLFCALFSSPVSFPSRGIPDWNDSISNFEETKVPPPGRASRQVS